jgi:hypothetical protein
MKNVLYYAIRLSGLYGPRIIAVTTERSSHWWGRDTRDDLGTHGRLGDLAGRFETIDQAKAVFEKVDKVHLHFRHQSSKLEDVRRRLRTAEEQMLRQVTRGVAQRGAEMLVVELSFKRDPS